MPVPRVLVVGPTLVDIYYIGQPRGLDQTAPIPVINITEAAHGVGGAANAASTLARLGADTVLVTALAADSAGEICAQCLKQNDVKLASAKTPGYKHAVKNRLYVGDHLVARFDSSAEEANVHDYIRDQFERAYDSHRPNVVLVSDYGNAVIDDSVLDTVMRRAAETDTPVIIDPNVRRMHSYKGAYAITPSAQQLAEYAPNTPVVQAMRSLFRELEPKNVVTTLGAEGASLLNALMHQNLPAIPTIVRDTCGAGDAFVAALAYCVGNRQSMRYAVEYANAAGSAKVGYFGAVPVGAHDVLRKEIVSLGSAAKELSLEEALRMRKSVKISKGKFGIANGVFDLMHIGHADMLRKAAKECDFLLVLVNSDESASNFKRRPINSYEVRSLMVASHPQVSAVLALEADDPAKLLELLEPDVLIKGPDNTIEMTPGASQVVANGGRFVVTTKEHDISTTAIIAEHSSKNHTETATTDIGT